MAATAEHVYTPTELNREVRLHLEAGFGRVVVEAEISNLSRPASGHLYFCLKDERAQVRCALFRSAVIKSGLRLENGMQVLARGRISLYEPRGEFQMIVDSVQAAGEGELQRQFEALKQKLQDEGLFDPARKRRLPSYPLRIGVVTSPRGAAVRDILHVLQRRWPLARVRLYPVLVQGEGAALEIRRALDAANRHGWPQLLIVGRGGGSLEDLMAFNDEGVARAVHASAIPVVSAVGHETDFSICDFVADLRAPTPSAAAELVTPDQAALRETFQRAGRQLLRRMRDRLQRDGQRLDHLAHRLQQRHPASRLADQCRRLQALEVMAQRAVRRSLDDRAQRLRSVSARLAAQRPERRIADLSGRLAGARRALGRLALSAVQARQQQLGELARTLHAVSPLAVIGRGYAVLTSAKTGTVVSSVQQVDRGAGVLARLKDGRLDCRVESVLPADPDAP
jgi:exodeoxyribonuclease VII large subunit